VVHAPQSPCYSLRGNDGYLFFEIGFMHSPQVPHDGRFMAGKMAIFLI
jgi:hypothetical protein